MIKLIKNLWTTAISGLIASAVIFFVILTTIASARVPNGVDIENFDANVNYMTEMYECAKLNTDHSLIVGAIYEQQRNLKIDFLNLSEYEKTDFFKEENTGEQILTCIENYLNVTKDDFNYEDYYTTNDVNMLAKVAYCESRGIKSKTEIACVMWVILNRVDNDNFPDTISDVVLQPNQFAYRSNASTVSDYGYDLKILATDVLNNWAKEKAGRTDYIRCLPKEYLYYGGDDIHNYFRTSYLGGAKWDYSYGYPYG